MLYRSTFSARTLQRFSSALRTAWRALHVQLSTVQDTFELEREATHLSLGVGFIAAYKPYTGSEVWVKPFDCQSNLFGELNVWHCHRIPTGSAALRQVACGRAHMVALTTDGKVYTAGSNAFGQCGNASQSEMEQHVFSSVPGFAERVEQVVCGLDHTLFRTVGGRVISCGWSADGQTGTGSYSNVLLPTPVCLPLELHISSIHSSADTSFAITGDRLVYGWGNNEYGQVGVASENEQICEPVPLGLSSLDGQIISVATGGAFTAFLTNEGSVYRVGYSIDDPSLSHKQSTTSKLLPPQQMCQARRIHDGRTSADHVCAIHAGLHYLVGETLSSHELIVWGRYPESSKENASSSYRKITLEPCVQSIAYGPTAVATLCV